MFKPHVSSVIGGDSGSGSLSLTPDQSQFKRYELEFWTVSVVFHSDTNRYGMILLSLVKVSFVLTHIIGTVQMTAILAELEFITIRVIMESRSSADKQHCWVMD
ncbi:hypothetical protein Tco_0634481 [Tanacetum coccineum]